MLFSKVFAVYYVTHMNHINKLWQNAELLIFEAGCCCFNGSVWRLCNPLLIRPLSHSSDVTAIRSRKNRFTVAYWSNLLFVMAPRHRVLVALVADEGSTSRRLWSGFFLDRIPVTSPEWEKGLRVTRHLVPSSRNISPFLQSWAIRVGGGAWGRHYVPKALHRSPVEVVETEPGRSTLLKSVLFVLLAFRLVSNCARNMNMFNNVPMAYFSSRLLKQATFIFWNSSRHTVIIYHLLA
jgi:hypothetical protein